MIYEKWIEWSNSKDFYVKCQDFLQSKHNISKLLFINYPGKLPFLWRLLFDMNARTLSPYLTKPPDSLFTDHLNEKMDMEIDSPS